MKTTIICSIIYVASQAAYSQSSVVYDSGTNITVDAGADLCADGFTVNGTSSWMGTRCSTPVAVETAPPVLPKIFSLSQNYPNPFNPATTIEFTVPRDGRVTLKIYDAIGREVATLRDGEAQAGVIQRETFNASSLSSGVYFIRLRFGDAVLIKKLVLVK